MKLRILDHNGQLWQWNTGQKMSVEDSGACNEVHFCNRFSEVALVVPVKEFEGARFVEVPNILLQTSAALTAYLYHYAEDGSETRFSYSFPVRARPKPDGYVYTETEVLNYAYLDERLKDLEGEGLANAIADYLEKNPPQAGATAEEAAQIQRNKEDIEQLSQDKLDASKLPEAVSDALAQAKASGEFKGEKGDPGDDYVLTEADKNEIAEIAADLVDVPSDGGGAGIVVSDSEPDDTSVLWIDTDDNEADNLQSAIDDALAQAKASGEFKGEPGADGKDYVLTDADKQEIAELTAPLVDVPEGGGSNQPLTFTGAVNATYDGSEAVTVNIPSGGGGGTAWHRIGEQKMDGVESAVSFDLNGETIIQVVVTAAWGGALTATKATVSLKYEDGETQEFKTQTMNATSYSPKNIFLIVGDSKMCRQMIFTKAEGATYQDGSGAFAVSYGYKLGSGVLDMTAEAKATEITITFDVAPSEHTVVMVGGM